MELVVCGRRCEAVEERGREKLSAFLRLAELIKTSPHLLGVVLFSRLQR